MKCKNYEIVMRRQYQIRKMSYFLYYVHLNLPNRWFNSKIIVKNDIPDLVNLQKELLHDIIMNWDKKLWLIDKNQNGVGRHLEFWELPNTLFLATNFRFRLIQNVYLIRFHHKTFQEKLHGIKLWSPWFIDIQNGVRSHLEFWELSNSFFSN